MTDGVLETSKVHHTFPLPVEDVRWLLWNGVVLAVYWWLLAYSYVHSISPIVGTDTFLYLRINAAKEIESIIWAAVLLPTVSTGWTKPSDVGLTILYFIALVPTLIIFGVADQPRYAMYTILAGYVAAWACCKIPIRIPHIRLRQMARSGIYISVAAVVFVLFWFITHRSQASLNYDINNIYDYRDDANSIFAVGPLIYVAVWVPQVLNPFLFCYFLLKKKWLWFAASFFFQFFTLVIYQEKGFLVPCVMLPLFYFAPTGRMGRVWLLTALIATIAACEALNSIYNSPLFMELWTRRFFFVQQFLYFSYFEVFGKIGFVYYSDSFLSSFIRYPFPYPSAPMVAYYAWGTAVGSPNTGFFGSGYMELGVLGVILSGGMAGLVLKLFDSAVPSKMPIWFFSTVAFLPFTSMLISQNFLTSLLTAGVGMLFVIMQCTRQLDELGSAGMEQR